MTLMSSKGSLGNVFFFHTYLVVSRREIKFTKVLRISQFIQEIINDMNEKLVFDGELIDGGKVWTHVPSTFFLEYHDHRRRLGVDTRMDNTRFKQLLKIFSISFFWEKG
jgi:hypothetical protein